METAMEDAAVRDLYRLLESDLLAMFAEALDTSPTSPPSPPPLLPAPDALELLLLDDELDDDLSYDLDLSAFAAFTASPSSSSSPPSPPSSPPTASPVLPAAPKFRAIRPLATAALPVLQARVAPPCRSRKRVKDELESLRLQVAELEAQLSRLKLSKRAEDAASDTESTASDSSGRERHERTLIVVKRAPAASTAYALWKRVAAHQLDARRTAEAENARLRSMLAAQARLAESVQRSLRKQPAASDIRQSQQPEKRLKCRRFLKDESLEAGAMHAALMAQMDPLYAMVDAVLADAGFSSTYQESCVGQVKTDAVTGRVFMDLASSIIMPFDLKSTSVAFWTLFNTSSDDLQAGAFKPVNPMKHVLSAHYTTTTPLRCGEASTEGYIIAKQFVEATRVVNVWSSVGTCESKVLGSGPVPVQERGWCVIEEVPAAARSGGSSTSSPMTIIRMMFRMYPDIDSACASDRFASANRFARTFTDAVTDSFQDNLESMHQATESIIMGIAVR